MLIVTPDWIIKCARSWSRVSEQDFLADQWKAKHKKPEPEKQPDANGATSSSDTGEPSESKTPSAEIKTDADSSNPTPVSAPASEGKTVSSILVKRGPGDAKPGKQVTFAQVIDDSGNPPSEDGAVHKSKMVRRSRVVRRPSGGSRPRTIAAGPVATGVVATGGTFDFYRKSKQRSASRLAPASRRKRSRRQRRLRHVHLLHPRYYRVFISC